MGLAHIHGWQGTLGLYLESFVQPFGTLWFIYLLPIFFVVTRALRGVPPLAIFLVAAILQIAPIDTGLVVVDEFCERFVFFSHRLLAGEVCFRDRRRTRKRARWSRSAG